MTVNVMPSFRISSFEHAANPAFDSGLWDNMCWPKLLASNDPGFALFSWDPWYSTHSPNPRWDFSKPYKKGSNGS